MTDAPRTLTPTQRVRAAAYLAALRNPAKRSYAQRYLANLQQPEPDGSEPDYRGLSYMAAQAVRLRLHAILTTEDA